MSTRFSSFREFYPFYLGEHQNRTCRRLHFAGSSLALGFIVLAVLRSQPLWLLAALVSGYALAWVGHFAFEKNRPATFRHPLYSFLGDWVMFKDMLIGRIPF
ncbi:Mpo1-like protein [Thermomonas hydrothermalis]|uniref:Transmembrane protein n=1 Tax=Thermomonas hydrothermalis TaxID=213588 RepID=A0A1M4Z9U9_9GAMM|nr:Mpo1-like protein [Thermomonas hydrothermalis]MCL6620051.1 DUF962 domain-containing protein [Thermomonas hydrothermalis]SHF14839.1 hypothetical protein SAMN02745204_01889 [Thermomonas hydrothermalis]